MKKKLVITTLSLCMILAAAPAQAFAGSTTACQNAATTSLGKYLNSCGSYSDCRSTFLKGCLTSLKNNCTNNSNNNCTNNNGNCTNNNQNNAGSNSLNNWQSQMQEYLDKYMGGGNNSGITGDNNAQETPSADQDANDSITNGENSSNNDSITNGENSSNNNNNNTENNNGNITNNNAGSSNNAGGSAAVGSYEKQVADIVNEERTAAGLSTLTFSSELSAVAEKKAEDMRDKGYFSHTSPTYGSPFEMMTQFGIKYSAAGENIAKGQKTPASVMNAWMNSSGHKANILNSNFENIGVGYVTDSNGTTYWVQMFTK